MAVTASSWGIVATIKAPAISILNFAAYHLDLGAHRLHIYLDEPNAEVFPHLKAHPKIRVQTCDESYWKRRKCDRPEGHQYRQTLNATHAYNRIQTDWIAHIDVDEFLWADNDLSQILSQLPAEVNCGRVYPIEYLPGGAHLYKTAVPRSPNREAQVREIYPTYAAFLKGGFMSHVAGKLFVRTGLESVRFRIHNVLQGREKNPGMVDLPQARLCHHHYESWEDWLASYRYRLERGSYRPSLGSDAHHLLGGLSKHELLSMIEEEQGIEGLKRFFDEVSAQDPEVFQRLSDRGMILKKDLELERKRQKQFPDFT